MANGVQVVDLSLGAPRVPRNEQPPNYTPQKILSVFEHNVYGKMNLVQSEQGANFQTEFRTGLLKWVSTWIITSQDGVYFKITHSMICLPPRDIPNWSITMQMKETLIVPDDDTLTPIKTILDFTVSNERPELKFCYNVDEERTGHLITNPNNNLWVNLEIAALKTSGLQNIITETIDFTEKFDQSNVVVEFQEQQFHFIYELLFLNSQIFYDEYRSDCHGVTADGIQFVKLDDEVNLNGFIEILKFLLYKTRITGGNVEEMLAAAKMLKFEMVLVACEEYLIKDPEIPENKKLCLAFQYDMCELQHIMTCRLNAQPASMQTITSEKFQLPEMTTKFAFRDNFKVSHGGPMITEHTITFMVPWRITIVHTSPDRLEYTVKPQFVANGFVALNWSIFTEVKLNFIGVNKSITFVFTPSQPKIHGVLHLGNATRGLTQATYRIQMEIKSVRGLRYQIDPSNLRKCRFHVPSATLVLKTVDQQFFVNGNFLAFHSEYFKAALTHLDQFPLDPLSQLPSMDFRDIDSKTLRKLLSIVYPYKSENLKVNMVHAILPVADRYLFTTVIKEIESFLLKTNPGLKSLQIAIDYNMKILKTEILEKFTCGQSIHDLVTRDVDYKNLSEEGKALLMDRMTQLPFQMAPTIHFLPPAFLPW